MKRRTKVIRREHRGVGYRDDERAEKERRIRAYAKRIAKHEHIEFIEHEGDEHES